MYKNVAILGSTGSVGGSTLDVIRLNSDKYRVIMLCANSNVDKLLHQCIEFKPQFVVIFDKDKISYLKAQLILHQLQVLVLNTTADLIKIIQSEQIDIVMSAIVGSSGLLPTIAAIKANKKVLIANKESLITGGKLIRQELANSTAQLIPVDSEHSAIFQALPHNYLSRQDDIKKIILTASGGPFFQLSMDKLQLVTPEQAVCHPNWSMGKKISVDSSTLMNKGLEVIEAYWLFDIEVDNIEVLIHPQSIIHSMVEYKDGSIMAQLGTPDMKTPIAYALSYPERIISGSKYLDFTQVGSLTFDVPDHERFPCLNLAFSVLRSGGAAPAVLSAANEIAVANFLEGKIKFYDIPAIINSTLDNFAHEDYNSLEEVLQIDKKSRQYAASLID